MHGMNVFPSPPRNLTMSYSFYSPGRFFAATELKSMLAHVVLSYDVKLEDNATRPQSLHSGIHIAAHPTARVMFRKRAH
jgi:hypothetical protein